MSRPLTATSILEAKGSFDKNPGLRRSGEPIPPSGGMVKPKLRGVASKIWDEYAPIAEGMGTAARGDEMAFRTLCLMEEQYRKDSNQQTSWMAERYKVLASFGLAGGASRAKFGKVGDKDEKKDPTAKYFDNVTIGPGNQVRQ